MKKLRVLLFLYFSLQVGIANGKDFGVVGETFKVIEKDPVEVIMQKLKVMEEGGMLAAHNKLIQNKIKKKVLYPKAVPLGKTAKRRKFFYEPSYTLKNDLKDHEGRVFKRAGTVIRPLENHSLRKNLLFIDPTSEKQLKFALDYINKHDTKLILINGSPIKLSEELGVPVYFDQQGIITKKLGIEHVPAIVEQSGNKLKITEEEV